MKFIRWFLGRVILLLNFVFSPRGVKRSPDAQKEADTKAQSMACINLKRVHFV